MCGIWAILGDNYVAAQHEVEFMKIVGRGPDLTIITKTAPQLWFGFHRLAIVEAKSDNSAQPIEVLPQSNNALKNNCKLSLICNGEIYNHLILKENSQLDGSIVKNNESDCAAIIHAFHTYKGDLKKCCAALDGVFAFLMTDEEFLYIARDPLGVRPLFYGIMTQGFVFGSEIKCIEKICKRVNFFPPGCCARVLLARPHKQLFIEQYYHLPLTIEINNNILDSQKILRKLLIDAVDKRLMGDRLFGFMLSGGLDSSLIASIATKILKKRGKNLPIAFSVGFADSPDLENARKVAGFLKIQHHVLVITPKDCINAISEVVYALETFDPLLIRCGVAHFLLCKYISLNSDVKILLSGEGADELFGSYAYMQRAPSHVHLHQEIFRRLFHLHQYDVLRCDRSTSCHGLEIRVPFLDKKFVNFVACFPPSYKLMTNKVEKYVLRAAFKGWLPDSVLWRNKEGFSEALGKVDLGNILQSHAGAIINDAEFVQRYKLFAWQTPQTKEEFWYRSLFEQYFCLQKVDSVIHVKVYRTAAWHTDEADVRQLLEGKENIDETELSDFISNFSKEEQELRYRRRSTGNTKLTGVA